MKKYFSLFVTLFLTVAALSFPLPAQATPTVVINSPTNAAQNLTFDVTIEVQVTWGSGEIPVSPVYVEVQDSSLTRVATINLTAVDTAKTTWRGGWGSLAFANGQYYLRAFSPFRSSSGPSGNAQSSLTQVTTRNGFNWVDDPAKTYAIVESPAEGFVARLNQKVEVYTRHRITWSRFEACGDYAVPVQAAHFNSWKNIRVDGPVQSYVLPKGTGEVSPWMYDLASDFTPQGGPFGLFYISAYTYGKFTKDEPMRQMASGANTFTVPGETPPGSP